MIFDERYIYESWGYENLFIIDVAPVFAIGSIQLCDIPLVFHCVGQSLGLGAAELGAIGVRFAHLVGALLRLAGLTQIDDVGHWRIIEAGAASCQERRKLRMTGFLQLFEPIPHDEHP